LIGQPVVLLVEDNENGLDMLQRRLSRAGYSVITAMDGEAAVTRAVTYIPDIVLMDKRLPRLDGLSAVRRIRAEACTRDIPVICLTADATAEDRRAALDVGCQQFLTKPVDFRLLLATMAALLHAAAGGD
jgi:DNA-binding response OmpR family regulator